MSYKTHGMDGSSIYKCWMSMRARCNNHKDRDYPKYGGRGIIVCPEWNNSFIKFYKDMGEKPSKTHSLDRIDVNGNYEKKNCRWATMVQQNNNKTTNHIIFYKGKRKTLTEWSRIFNINTSTLINRINRGWSIHKTFTYPVEIHKKYGNN